MNDAIDSPNPANALDYLASASHLLLASIDWTSHLPKILEELGVLLELRGVALLQFRTVYEAVHKDANFHPIEAWTDASTVPNDNWPSGQLSVLLERYVLQLHQKHVVILPTPNWAAEWSKAKRPNAEHINFARAERTVVEHIAESSQQQLPFELATASSGDQSAGSCAVVALPICVRQIFWGVLLVENHAHDYVWRREEFDLLRTVACMLSSAIARRQSERALQQSQQVESVNMLANTIAHDFHALLIAISVQTSLALAKLPLASQARLNVEHIAAATSHASNATVQMLRLAEDVQAISSAFSLNELVLECVELLSVNLSSAISLQLELRDEVMWMHTSRSCVQQIVFNLFFHIIETLRGDEGQLNIATTSCIAVNKIALHDGQRRIETEIHCDDRRLMPRHSIHLDPGHYALLKFEDNGGAGYSERLLNYSTDGERSEKAMADSTEDLAGASNMSIQGAKGMRIATVNRIVQQLRGVLHVEQGSERMSVYVALPIEASDKSRVPQHEAASVDEQRAPLTALVIDDEMAVREAISDILSEAGMHTVEAANGRDGLLLFHEHRKRIDLVILDMKMPIMNGADTHHALRLIDPDIPIILSSGYTDAMTLPAEDSRRTAFLPKPYGMDELIQVVHSQLITKH